MAIAVRAVQTKFKNMSESYFFLEQISIYVMYSITEGTDEHSHSVLCSTLVTHIREKLMQIETDKETAARMMRGMKNLVCTHQQN